MKSDGSKSGFTLIELLIVVAIIAILAAIAVPNFLEAQTRAKVARVRADLRSLQTAIESYHIDHGGYPLHMLVNQTGNNEYFDPWPHSGGGNTYNEFHFSRIFSITTPITYISAQPPDPFYRQNVPVNPGSNIMATGRREARRQYQYANSKDRAAHGSGQAVIDASQAAYGGYVTWSGGPDGFRRDVFLRSGNPKDSMRIYEPTNGTISVGDIWRTQKSPDGSRPIVPGFVE